MKKFYTEPELELINIRLTADVLSPSKEDATEDDVPIEGTEFDDGGFDF